MLPDCDLQLRVVIKALQDVVVPAVDPANQLAVEQIRLSLATLEMVRSRVPLVDKCARKELANAVEMAAALCDAGRGNEADDLRRLIGEAQQALGVVDPSRSDLVRIRTALLGAVSTMIDDADASDVGQLSRIGLAKAKAQVELQRSWCTPSGFEPDPSAIPAIEDLLDM